MPAHEIPPASPGDIYFAMKQVFTRAGKSGIINKIRTQSKGIAGKDEGSMEKLLIRGVRIINPAQSEEYTGDIAVENGTI